MSTPINKSANDKFNKPSQPLNLVKNAQSLEEGVEKLVQMAPASQRQLVVFMEAAASAVRGFGVQATYYNPGIKSYESALRKAKKGYGFPGRIRLLTDTYRGSMILQNLHALEIAQNFIKGEC